MDLKGAEIRNVKNLCSEMGSKENVPMRVNIPYYQRPYKWGEDNIKNLIIYFILKRMAVTFIDINRAAFFYILIFYITIVNKMRIKMKVKVFKFQIQN